MKAILIVETKDLVKAAEVAQTADKFYREAIDAKKKVVLEKKFVVHETEAKTIVVNYKK